jgi:predicted transcriptional regulator
MKEGTRMAQRLTPRELDVIGALWRLESGTVAEVLDKLDDELAYTTVLTVLRGLEQKGFVRHEREGRAHRFYPEVRARRAATGLLERLIDKVYQGSPVRLVAHLVAERDLSAKEIEEITELLEELPGKRPATERATRSEQAPAKRAGRARGKRR